MRTIKRRHPIEAEIAFCVRGVNSPVLSNIFLHHVLDQWFEDEVKPRLRGQATLVLSLIHI